MNAADKHFVPPIKPGMRLLPISLAEMLAYDNVIDVRSPAEFAEDHLPGAINLPVLDNDERVRVGTMHKQESAFAAKKIGAVLVARNIATHIEAHWQDKPKNWSPLIYCWRGGSRSGAMTHILRSIGWPALQLSGGYKAWRGQVMSDLTLQAHAFSYQVICGRTGSGKSRLLDALASTGHQVLDLEKLAAHKGSVLGNLPNEAQPSQRLFESRIWAQLSVFDSGRPVYVEAESKKVGVVQVPTALMDCMRASPCHEVITPAPLRATLLREEYVHLIDNRPLLFDKLDCLHTLHSREQIDRWKALAHAAKWDEFVADMLANHYDPAYGRSMFRNYVRANVAVPLPIDNIGEHAFIRVAQSLPA